MFASSYEVSSALVEHKTAPLLARILSLGVLAAAWTNKPRATYFLDLAVGGSERGVTAPPAHSASVAFARGVAPPAGLAPLALRQDLPAQHSPHSPHEQTIHSPTLTGNGQH